MSRLAALKETVRGLGHGTIPTLCGDDGASAVSIPHSPGASWAVLATVELAHGRRLLACDGVLLAEVLVSGDDARVGLVRRAPSDLDGLAERWTEAQDDAGEIR